MVSWFFRLSVQNSALVQASEVAQNFEDLNVIVDGYYDVHLRTRRLQFCRKAHKQQILANILQ